MSDHSMEVFQDVSISKHIVTEAAKLFSAHYGVWGLVTEEKTKGRTKCGKLIDIYCGEKVYRKCSSCDVGHAVD